MGAFAKKGGFQQQIFLTQSREDAKNVKNAKANAFCRITADAFAKRGEYFRVLRRSQGRAFSASPG